MKRVWLLAGIALLFVAGVLVATRRSGDDPTATALAAQARAEARAAGFKLDLTEFDFALDEAARRRLAAVTNAGALLAHEPWLGQLRWMQRRARSRRLRLARRGAVGRRRDRLPVTGRGV